MTRGEVQAVGARKTDEDDIAALLSQRFSLRLRRIVIFASRMPQLLSWLAQFGPPSLVSIGVTYLMLRLTQTLTQWLEQGGAVIGEVHISARKGEYSLCHRDELGREHVQTAVSRGIPYPQLVRRHVLRNAAIPITTVVGITIASLIALAAIVETAFGLNGLGAYLVQAAQNKDFATVQGISLVLVFAFVITNVIIDITYAILDPRVTLGSRAQ